MKFGVIAGLLIFPSFISYADSCNWPEWDKFKQHYIVDGRVVDYSDERQITTSEGQSYAMFFALVANDQAMFDQLFHWTQTHLAGGSLSNTLPSWLWGRDLESGRDGVLDSNSASDSDLWMAYDLAEAGRLWDNYAYRSTASLLAKQILDNETVEVKHYGWVLLPGPMGFDIDKSTYRLNPSYSPLQLLRRFTELSRDPKWNSLLQSGYQITLDSAVKGFSPDWVLVNQGRLKMDKQTSGLGSYNSIRSYLWAGMLSNDAVEKSTLLAQFTPMATITSKRGAPPRLVNTQDGSAKEQGSIGFSAALLPMLKSLNDQFTLEQQIKRVAGGLDIIDGQHYYDSVLTLFGLGWAEGRYQFGSSGELITSSKEQCIK
jgi:endoglucanase